MKTNLLFLITFSFFIFFICSCNKNSAEQEEQPEVTGKIISYSDCLDHLKMADQTMADSNLSCIIYDYDPVSKKLNLTHENAGFNCCPGAITSTISFSGDTIVILESEEYAICNCNCLFNLEIELNGLLSKTYFVKFIEPYVKDQEKLEFSIDLQQQPSGEYCVERNQYPWGI